MYARARILGLTLVLVGAILLAACGAGVGGGARDGDTVLVGAALPRTGELAREGQQQQDGFDLWAETVNAQGGIQAGGKRYHVEMRYYDYQSDNTRAVKLVEKLIVEDQARFIFGPFGSGATLAASAVTDQHAVPMLAPSASAESVYQQGRRYLFGLLAPNAALGTAAIDLLVAQSPGPRTMAILSRNDLLPTAVARAVEAAGKEKGIETVYFAEYPIGSADLSALLLAARGQSPDILVGTGSTNDLVLLTRQMKELRFSPKLTIQPAGTTDTSYTEALGADANYMLSPTWWVPNSPYHDNGTLFGTAADFARRFHDQYGYDADYLAAAAAACGAALQAAIEQAGTTDPVKVRDALASLDVNTFFGRIRFNEGGQNVGASIPVLQVQNGQPVVVAPRESATGTLVYPVPEWDRR